MENSLWTIHFLRLAGRCTMTEVVEEWCSGCDWTAWDYITEEKSIYLGQSSVHQNRRIFVREFLATVGKLSLLVVCDSQFHLSEILFITLIGQLPVLSLCCVFCFLCVLVHGSCCLKRKGWLISDDQLIYWLIGLQCWLRAQTWLKSALITRDSLHHFQLHLNCSMEH